MGGVERATGWTILVVDDDQTVLRIVSSMLRRGGYSTHVASSGEAAEQLLEQQGGGVDAMVVDLRMPGISGVELAERARVRYPRVATVFMSGYTDEPLEQPPGADVLEKPFTGERLLRAVGDALAAR
jgi:CheY-like chemotaxis protein